eukprot:3206246-Rhodomonas_salina.2
MLLLEPARMFLLDDAVLDTLPPGLIAGLLLALYGPTGGSMGSRSGAEGSRSSATGCSFKASPSLRISPCRLLVVGVSLPSAPICNSGSTSFVVYSGETLLAVVKEMSVASLSLSLRLKLLLLALGEAASQPDSADVPLRAGVRGGSGPRLKLAM